MKREAGLPGGKVMNNNLNLGGEEMLILSVLFFSLLISQS